MVRTLIDPTPAGELTTLFSFGLTNGNAPRGVVEGTDGNFYGATQAGGTLNFGTIFRLTPAGSHTVLLSFNGTNGAIPRTIVQGSDGYLYGTTIYGGAGFSGSLFSGGGTVFKVTPAGDLTTLCAFAWTNGQAPHAELVEAADGCFYGTTELGGTANMGTVFRVTTNGSLTTIASLQGPNGSYPDYGLCRGRDGNLYGAISGGGNGGGVICRLVPPITTQIAMSNGTVRLTWNAFSNGVYRVESQNSPVGANWAGLHQNVISTGTTAEFAHVPEITDRQFYRVVLLPAP